MRGPQPELVNLLSCVLVRSQRLALVNFIITQNMMVLYFLDLIIFKTHFDFGLYKRCYLLCDSLINRPAYYFCFNSSTWNVFNRPLSLSRFYYGNRFICPEETFRFRDAIVYRLMAVPCDSIVLRKSWIRPVFYRINSVFVQNPLS